MSNEEVVNTDVSQAGESSAKEAKWKITDKFSLDLLVSNIPFLLFIAGLGMIYITNNTKAAELVRALDQKTKELKELKWEYSDVQARLIYATSESQIHKQAAVHGLAPLEKPAFEIKNTVEIYKDK